MAFDFASVQIQDESRVLDIRHPSNGQLLASITLTSITAEKPTEIRRRQDRRRFKNARSIKLDPVELESDALDLLAACTVSWQTADGGNKIIFQGEELECNHTNARRLYESIKWVRDEVDRFVNDVTVFLEPSQTTSGSL